MDDWREKALAESVHHQFIRWITDLIQTGSINENGELVIPEWQLNGWLEAIHQQYTSLQEHEKMHYEQKAREILERLGL